MRGIGTRSRGAALRAPVSMLTYLLRVLSCMPSAPNDSATFAKWDSQDGPI